MARPSRLASSSLGRARRTLTRVIPSGTRVGQVPGTLPASTSDPLRAPTRLTLFRYGPDHVAESEPPRRALADIRASLKPGEVLWLNVDGLGDPEALAQVGEAFGLHALLLEDVAHTPQRPKLELHDDVLFVVVRMIRPSDEIEGAVPAPQAEQVALVLGPDFVLSFQEAPGDVFEPVRTRIRESRGRVRAAGADYLAYALLDLIVDQYLVVIEHLGDATEALEGTVLDRPSPAVQADLNALRQELIALRRAVWPLREVFASLYRDPHPLILDTTRPYLRDAYDHVLQATDLVEVLREMAGSLGDLYLSALGFKQNEVMRVLTVVGALFLPITFLTGLYGMNFAWMPELGWRYSYFVFLAVLLGVSAGTLWAFKRRGWL